MTAKQMQAETAERKCVVPGCGRTLPSDAKVPLCEWHRGEIKEKVKKGGAVVLSTAGGAILFVKKDGVKYVGKAVDMAKRFIR